VGNQSPRGTYLDIARVLREEIASGVFVKGAALPSEAALVKRFGVARETVRRGLSTLEHEDLVSKAQGKRWFVGSEPSLMPVELAPILATLRAAIDKDFNDGDRFHSEKVLTEEYGITRHQVRQILSALESDELLITAPGKGRFVRTGPKDGTNA
jgi:DNA-binding GntR family transcriptional regulator